MIIPVLQDKYGHCLIKLKTVKIIFWENWWYFIYKTQNKVRLVRNSTTKHLIESLIRLILLVQFNPTIVKSFIGKKTLHTESKYFDI